MVPPIVSHTDAERGKERETEGKREREREREQERERERGVGREDHETKNTAIVLLPHALHQYAFRVEIARTSPRAGKRYTPLDDHGDSCHLYAAGLCGFLQPT
jgi:hypothetical protein